MSSWAGIDEFVAVAQTRHFGMAAQRLKCSASQVSREIASLEDRLGLQLFYRTTRHVSLTEVGERFLVTCRRLFDEREEAIAALIDDGEQLRGNLRLTCSVAYGERFVVPIVNRMMSDNLLLNVEVLLTDDVLDLVEQGIDLAIRFGKLRDSRLVATRLASRTRLLCASPAYVAQNGIPQNLEDLARHECLRGVTDTWTFKRDGHPHLHRPQGRFRCNSGFAALQAALSGLGLCRLPDFYVLTHLERGELVELLPEHRPEDEGVWAVYPDRRHLPTKVTLLLEGLHAGLKPRTGLHNPG